jgi:hypothetical protein
MLLLLISTMPSSRLLLLLMSDLLVTVAVVATVAVAVRRLLLLLLTQSYSPRHHCRDYLQKCLQMTNRKFEVWKEKNVLEKLAVLDGRAFRCYWREKLAHR